MTGHDNHERMRATVATHEVRHETKLTRSARHDTRITRGDETALDSPHKTKRGKARYEFKTDAKRETRKRESRKETIQLTTNKSLPETESHTNYKIRHANHEKRRCNSRETSLFSRLNRIQTTRLDTRNTRGGRATQELRGVTLD